MADIEYDVNVDGDRITLSAPDHRDELLAGSTAATLTAENIEGRHGEDTDLALSLRTAARFANDVVKFDMDPEDAPARGQYADVLLLHMATAAWTEMLDHGPNKGGDPEEYARASEFFMRVESTLIRVLGIQAVGGRMEQVPYSYGAMEEKRE